MSIEEQINLDSLKDKSVETPKAASEKTKEAAPTAEELKAAEAEKALAKETDEKDANKIREEIAMLSNQEEINHGGKDPHYRFGNVSEGMARRLRMKKKK